MWMLPLYLHIKQKSSDDDDDNDDDDDDDASNRRIHNHVYLYFLDFN